MRPKTKKRAPSARAHEAAEGAISCGVIELCSGEVYKLRAFDGSLCDVRLGPGVSRALADECLRDRRTVLCCSGVILGALQTEPSTVRREPGGALLLEAPEARIVAERKLTLRAGNASIELDADGALRIAGERARLDVAALIQLLSAKVELP